MSLYALKTDTAIVPPSRTQPIRFILKSQDPRAFFLWLHMSTGFFVVMTLIALVRLAPVEDYFAAWKAKI